MKWLNEKIEKNGKDIEFIRKTYKYIFDELSNSWEFFTNEELDEKHDFKIVYKIETWKDYAIHDDDNIKRILKI